MTSEMNTVIAEIRAKALQLHQDLVTERERISAMSEEISRLNEHLKLEKEQSASLKLANDELQESLNEKREQVQPHSTGSSDQEIDVLVKEIDFCIKQLKIANE